MNTTIKTLSVAAALAASLGLAGCAANAGSGNSTPMDHGNSSPMSSPVPSASMMPGANADHNQADIMFAQMMIPHHAQAVQMTGHHEGAIDMAQQEISAGKFPDAMKLGRDIVAAQQAEITQMKQLLSTL